MVRRLGGGTAALVAAAILLFALADIRSGLPINDDWAYYTPVRWLTQTGRLGFTDWQYMTLLTQVALGWGWTALFGYSVTGLRLLTIAVSLVGLVALVRLNRLAVGRTPLALALAALAYFSPLLLANAASFMTDLYFWALTIIALWLLYEGLARGSRWFELAGWLVAFAALLERQLALAIPIGFLAACLARDVWRRPAAWRAIVPLVLMAATLALYKVVIRRTIGLPADFDQSSALLRAVVVDLVHGHPRALQPTLRGLGFAALYFGFLAFPLGIALLARGLGRGERLVAGAVGVVALLVTIAMGAPLPAGGNVLATWGLGPRLLAGVEPPPPGAGWWLLTALACLSLGAMLVALAVRVRAGLAAPAAFLAAEHVRLGLLVTAAVAYAPLIVMYGPWLDRHLLLTATLLLPVVAGLGGAARPGIARIVLVLTVPLALAGLIWLHDSFAWRRAVETAIARLEARGIAPDAIDGGFEYVNVRAQPTDPAGRRPPLLAADVPRRCVVAERLPAGYAGTDTVAVAQWLPLGARAIHAGCAA